MDSLADDLSTMPRVPLAPDHVAALHAIGTERAYPAGTTVVDIGTPMDQFVYVLDGEIELVDPFSGERMVPSTLGPTQFMGEIGFLNGGSYMLPMRAAKDTRTLEVPREEMLALMARVPELSDHVIRVFSARRRRQFEDGGSAITLVGADQDPAIQRVERFLSRNRIPFQSFDLDGSDDDALAACKLVEHRPAVVLGQERVIEDPTPRRIAELLNLDLAACSQTLYDVLIVGGGPAGVAAAVYAGAEGLCAMVVEDTAIGGQAGTSSRIENYMGFPTGISGTDLVFRGQVQALKFGTRFAMPRRAERLERREDGVFCVTLDGGDVVCARTVLVAAGVQYRGLPIERLEDFDGAGLFYAATDMEARFCRSTDAVVIGGGNSAGQAAMYLSRSAGHVHVVVRGKSLASSMSSYLSERLEADPRITIHYDTELVALHGEGHLEAATFRRGGEELRLDTRALFVMIGAAPNTDWLCNLVQTDDKGFVLTGSAVDKASPFATSCDGIYAVGDVRGGSVKRVASAVGEGSVVVSEIWAYVDRQKTDT